MYVLYDMIYEYIYTQCILPVLEWAEQRASRRFNARRIYIYICIIIIIKTYVRVIYIYRPT